ncbi:MAG: site-2 protease family protein, partial [Erysipelotrichaceae bacterium]|nr:site-2 protease family protein [Erysipelotrichaceae bacterium]
MLSLILFIIILGTIVLIHELGHFLFAKLFGVYVYEYSIGMGKKIFSRKPKNSETE